MRAIFRVIGTVDGKETVIGGKYQTLELAVKSVNDIYDDIKTQSYLDWDEIYIQNSNGQVYVSNEDGRWICEELAGSYEQHCDEYATNGDPQRDAMEYEEAALYDQYDGHRADFSSDGEYDDEPVADPEGAWFNVLWSEEMAEELWCDAWADAFDPTPF